MIEDYKDRLEKAMKHAGVDLAMFASTLGISYQAVKKIVDGKSSAFTAANNSKAAKFLSVNTDWLATGEGEMFRTDAQPDKQIAAPKIELLSSEQILKGLAACIADIDPGSRDELAPMLSALVIGPDSQEIIEKIKNYIDQAPLKKRGASKLGIQQPIEQHRTV